MRCYLLRAADWSDFSTARVLSGPPTGSAPGLVFFAVVPDRPAGEPTGEPAGEPTGEPMGKPAGPPRVAEWIVAPQDVTEGSAAAGAPSDPRPVYIAQARALSDPAFWRAVLKQHPRHPVDLAAFAAREKIAPEIFLEALELRSDYRTRDEWAQMGSLQEDTRALARRYDFPFALLRLWDRLGEAQRAAWREIFEERRIKKNLIREIIVDVYDLPEADRAEVLRACLDYSAAWQARSGGFPAEDLRDLVRAKRHPRLEQNRAALAAVKKELGLPRGARLQLPPDLESTRLRLELEFDSIDLLERQLKYFDAEKRALLDRMLDLL